MKREVRKKEARENVWMEQHSICKCRTYSTDYLYIKKLNIWPSSFADMNVVRDVDQDIIVGQLELEIALVFNV